MTTITAPQLPPTTTTPGGILILTPGAPTPAPDSGFVRTPGGVLLPDRSLQTSVARPGLIQVTTPLRGSDAVTAARDAHAQLASTGGAAAADIVVRDQVQIAEQVRNSEIRSQMVEALRAGDLETASALADQLT